MVDVKKKFNNGGQSKKPVCWGIGIAILICCILVFCFKFLDTEKNVMKKDVVVNKGCVNVLVADTIIKAGDYANKDMVRFIEVQAEEVPKNTVKDINDLNGQRIIRDIQPEEFIYTKDLINKKQWGEKNDRFVEHLFIDGAIPTTLPGFCW